MNSDKISKTDLVQEKELHPINGFPVLLVLILAWIGSVVAFVMGVNRAEMGEGGGVGLIILGAVMFITIPFFFSGFHIINPNEAKVLAVFGKYIGTVKKSGFFYVRPFSVSLVPNVSPSKEKSKEDRPNFSTGDIDVTLPKRKVVSLKTSTLNNTKQKVNDSLGNPIIIGAVVIWKVVNPTAAVLNVENYASYLSIQCDSTIRNIARLYPYDTLTDEHDEDEKTLRGSSLEIANRMRDELQTRVADAGLEVMEVRITHLSYAEEIAHAMLQRQQAVAVIAARQKIVEGAVGMVQMAIREINEDDLIVLDDERLASMVSNLLVVLCSNKDITPVVNSGSIY